MSIGGIAWLVLLGGVATYDLWAWATRSETLTDEQRKLQSRWRYFRWVFALGLIVLWAHLFWGR